MAQLQDRLEQVEDSLATALARIEAQRNRDKLLTRENQLLRRMLKEAGVRNVPGTHQGSPGPSPTAAGKLVLHASVLGHVSAGCQPGDACRQGLSEPCLLYVSYEKQGTVKVPGQCAAAELK